MNRRIYQVGKLFGSVFMQSRLAVFQQVFHISNKGEGAVDREKLEKIIDFAINKETEDQRLYKKGIEKSEDEGLRHLLRSILDQEQDHEKMLKELKEDEDYYNAFAAVEDGALYIDEHKESESFTEAMDYKQVLRLIIQRESGVVTFYTKLAQLSSDSDISFTFQKLADEEKKHQKWTQDRYDLEMLK
ncbi:MAG: ferritin family protein [Spirochaetia bacterium]